MISRVWTTCSWGFILLLSVPWNWRRTKCFCHTTFFHRPGTFSIYFWGNTDIALDDCESDGFILTTRTLSSCKIVKLKLMTYIPWHLYIRILKFPVFTFRQSGLSFLSSILISRTETRQMILIRYLFPK